MIDTANLKTYLEGSQNFALDKVNKIIFLKNFNIFVVIYSPIFSARSEFEVPWIRFEVTKTAIFGQGYCCSKMLYIIGGYFLYPFVFLECRV